MPGPDDVAQFTFLNSGKSHVEIIVQRGKYCFRIAANRKQITRDQLRAAPPLRIGDVITTGPDTYASLEFVIGGRVFIKPSGTVIVSGERSVHRKFGSESEERWRLAKTLIWKTASSIAPGTLMQSQLTLYEYSQLGFVIGFEPEIVPIAAAIFVLSIAVVAMTPPTKERQPNIFREGFSPGAIRG